mgnify:CR=1 FL=1
MHTNRKVTLSILLSLMMISLPWAAADVSSWIGPSQIASSGQDVEVDGWNVPSNATILDGWMTADDKMVSDGNGTEWRVDTTTNFSVGQFTDATMDHFDGRLSLMPDAAVSNVDSFLGQVTLNFANVWSESGNTSIWEPSIPSIINGTTVGNTRQLSHGNIPAAAHSGSTVAATLAGAPVPAGENAALVSGPTTLPSPINNFNFTMWNWRHTDASAGDAVWVEYKLDNGAWTWIEPVGGYNSNVTMNTSSTPAGTPSNSSTFPAWSDSNETGWVQETFILDNLTSINSSTQIHFRFLIHTDSNSSGMPGWFLDDLSITNLGGAANYWHHGCYSNSATTCQYSNNAEAALERSFNLSSAGAGSTLRTVLEWDLEGSSWDNFWVEMSTTNTTWTDLTGTGTAGIPSNGYSVGGTQYGDETSGFITLDLSIPATFQGQNQVDVRYRVKTDSSIQYGGTQDTQEGLTLDSISVLDGSGNLIVSDNLNSQSTMTHYSILNGANDWQFISIGAGALSNSDGFENSAAGAPGGFPAGWGATGDWDFGPISSTASNGPTLFPTAPFGFGVNLGGSYSGSNWDHLYSPQYTIPSGASARLTFSHWICAESSYDGGAVFISTDNQTWTHFDPGNNWYDVVGLPFNANANLANLGVFDGRNAIPPNGFNCQGQHSLWNTKTGDLTAYSGQNVWFRFSFESDSIVNYDGWYLDDIGLDVDYFYDEGNWVSDLLQIDGLGGGFIDMDGVVPDDTWATASIMDASGTLIDGFSNQSFPISLHGIDKDTHSSIRVQVKMGTNNPFLTPLIDAVHVGSIRTMDARGTGNGWDVAPTLDLWDGNLTNNGSAVLQINSEFTHSSRPITSIDFTGVGSQVTIRAIDASGSTVGQSGLSGTITFPEPQPGFGIQIEINPGGHISSLWAEGVFGQPAVNPEADVTSDGTIDWSFPTGTVYGNHGWQQLLFQTTSSPGTLTHIRDTASTNFNVDSSGSTVSVLIPEDATVHTTTVSAHVSSLTGPTPGVPVFFSIGSSSSITFTDGYTTTSLPSTMIAYINMVQPSHTQPQTGRDWRVVEFDLSTSGLANVDINAITIGYSISENITGLTQQMVDYHRVTIAQGAGGSVDIPVTYSADAGAVIFDGGIHHELMITNHPFTVPITMYPDGNVVEITTRHNHLYDNDAIAKISLTGSASDGTSIVFEVDAPSTNATFSQVSGSNQLPMETNCTVTENAGILEIDWRFRVSWTWDDVTQIDWSALSYNVTGEAIAPAVAQSGGSGSQAVENDLEVSGFEVYDDQGRHLSNQFSPDYPFHSRSGHNVSISGTVRFQNTVDLRPLQSDFAMIVNVSGNEMPMTSDGDGSFSSTIPLTAADSHTLSPSIGRAGPVTGSTGANDSTVSPPVVTVMMDDEAPIANPFLVSTSVGQLDANGYVWDPINPLTVHITVSDEQDRGEELILHYWREGIDDTNGDGFAQSNEYLTMTESLYPLRSGSQQVSFSNIQIATNGFNAKVSLWVEGTDWAGNSYQEGGTGGGPGLASDWATLQTAQNTETTLLNTGFSLDTWNEHLLAGQTHTFSMIVQDANGVQTLDDITVYLAGQSYVPLGQFNYDPRQDELTTPPNSHVEPISATVTPMSEDTSRLDITFSMDWDTPTSNNWYVPGVTVTDDTATVANLNNLNAMRWKLDNVLTAVTTDLVDLTPPISGGDSTTINVQEGDELIVEGVVQYSATSIPIPVPSEGLAVRAQILVGSVVVEKVVDVQMGGLFNAPLVLPQRTPPAQQLPIELVVLNVPGSGSSLSNTDSSVIIDSNSPLVVFNQNRFPYSSLLLLESDQLGDVQIDILVEDSGGMPTDNLTVNWEFYRNGLPRLGVGNSGALTFVAVEGEQTHFQNQLDMRPTDGLKLLEGDQIVIWFEGVDLAGNSLEGDGTEDSPRVPLLEIIEFVPLLSSWMISPESPDYGDMVQIHAIFANDGLRAGSINVTLVENIDDDWHTHSSTTLNLTSLDTDATIVFEWEAWKAGPAELYIYIDGDSENPLPVDEFTVKGEESSSAGEASTILLIAVVGILAILVVGLLGVIVLRKPSVSMDDYHDDIWDDEEENTYGTAGNIRLDYEDDTLWNTVSRHGIYDKDAFLAHALRYDRDGDGFLDATELDRAAADFTSMMTKPTPSTEVEYPFDFNDETVAHVIESHEIQDKAAFLKFAHDYDEDQNGYLKHSELSRAAEDFAASEHNVAPSVQTTPDPRLLAVAEVRSALPDWSESKINSWMDKGWTTQQIISDHAEPVQPPAPAGFGDDYVEPVVEPVVEEPTEPVVEEPTEPVVEEIESEPDSSTSKSLMRLKKTELVELANLQGIDSSGTKADIVARLLS